MEHLQGPFTYRGTMNGKVIYILQALSEPELSIAMNGGPGLIATVQAPDIGMLEAYRPSQTMKNVKFIVRAMNHHYLLLEALETLLELTAEGPRYRDLTAWVNVKRIYNAAKG